MPPERAWVYRTGPVQLSWNMPPPQPISMPSLSGFKGTAELRLWGHSQQMQQQATPATEMERQGWSVIIYQHGLNTVAQSREGSGWTQFRRQAATAAVSSGLSFSWFAGGVVSSPGSVLCCAYPCDLCVSKSLRLD